MERVVRDIYLARACAHARHTNDTHAFPQTTFFAVSKSRRIASSIGHLIVTEIKRTTPSGSPFKSARISVDLVNHDSYI